MILYQMTTKEIYSSKSLVSFLERRKVILNECDFHNTVGLENLINRSLLAIDKNNKITMHQLLRDTGREIISQESPNKPGKLSRLWHHKDSFNVSKQKTEELKCVFTKYCYCHSR